jgi:hypothetical protein
LHEAAAIVEWQGDFEKTRANLLMTLMEIYLYIHAKRHI